MADQPLLEVRVAKYDDKDEETQQPETGEALPLTYRRHAACKPFVLLLLIGVGVASLFLYSRNGIVSTDAKVDDQVQYWISQLSLKEKCELLRGSVDTHGYTGYVPGVPRLGIPSLRMNDGPQGFRGPKKTSTAFPCK
jgi:hypothetical protein